jgi:hypothetical protein
MIHAAEQPAQRNGSVRRRPPATAERGPSPRVALLEELPDLAADLDPGRRDDARRRAWVTVRELSVGTWKPERENRAGHLGLMVLDGALVHVTCCQDQRLAEVILAGDAMYPWLADDPLEPLETEDRWRVLASTRLAVCDRRFAVHVAAYPEIVAAILASAAARTRRMALCGALGRLRRVEDRLAGVLYHLAGRCGRVTREGIVLALHLTHAQLGEIVGARRPTVTKALGVLCAQGRLAPHPVGWLLPAAGTGWPLAG